MSVSNCSAAGADATTQAITGAVQRKDKTTGETVPATVRPNGADPDSVQTVQGTASLNSAALAALLSFNSN
ncbi:MAG: hypothetical protein GC129_01790 [Proteobacteria bacterium]|nr:hypothetical protein [Pseudomonadota bacterium]